MSTEVLNPLLNYFSPLIPAEADQARASRIEVAHSGVDVHHPIFTAALHVVVGALVFAVLLLPSLLLLLLNRELVSFGLASSAIASFIRVASNALALIDLVLFLMYVFRTLLRAILLV